MKSFPFNTIIAFVKIRIAAAREWVRSDHWNRICFMLLLLMEYLFIDFDGVICDSVDEAFISSWYACRKRQKSVSIRDHILFCAWRPYIKAGADFILLQHCLIKNINIQNQDHYNRIHGSISSLRQRSNHRRFYRARTFLLRNCRDFWLNQNRLYPGMRDRLEALAEKQHVYILSTKKSAFILEILGREGISWPAERVLYSSGSEKIPVIESFLTASDDRAILLDDQSEYFTGHERISFFLACWGYVADQEAARTAADRIVTLDDLDVMLGI
ncbi:MAG: hypothetical protein JW874_08665 [Spirochaetales bacterium]|nr:hypothetical protein [Spirochaetales bacterium]